MDFIKKAELIKQMETTKKRELRSVLDLAASAALLVVLNRSAGEISTAFGLNRSFADILTGIILFFIIGCTCGRRFIITRCFCFRRWARRSGCAGKSCPENF